MRSKPIELNWRSRIRLGLAALLVRQGFKSLFVVLALGSPHAFAQPIAQSIAQPIAIGLFGDTAYSARERELLAFVIHDGDIKSGGSLCSDAVFMDILGVFQASRHPLIYVPGDNEWTDCHRQNNGPFDPLERLGKFCRLPRERALGSGWRPFCGYECARQ
jgi:hypothetical protein